MRIPVSPKTNQNKKCPIIGSSYCSLNDIWHLGLNGFISKFVCNSKEVTQKCSGLFWLQFHMNPILNFFFSPNILFSFAVDAIYKIKR